MKKLFSKIDNTKETNSYLGKVFVVGRYTVTVEEVLAEGDSSSLKLHLTATSVSIICVCRFIEIHPEKSYAAMPMAIRTRSVSIELCSVRCEALSRLGTSLRSTAPVDLFLSSDVSSALSELVDFLPRNAGMQKFEGRLLLLPLKNVGLIHFLFYPYSAKCLFWRDIH